MYRLTDIFSIGYMNSILQCLIGTRLLEKELEERKEYTSEYPFHATLQSIFVSYRQAEVEFQPSAMREILTTIDRKYAENKQEDACEALNLFLTKTLEEEMKKEDKKFGNTLLGHIFGANIATRSKESNNKNSYLQ